MSLTSQLEGYLAYVNTTIPDIEAGRGGSSLWRYMDIAKFLSMLTTDSLHFTNLGEFQDKYEGTAPIASVLAHADSLQRAGHTAAEAQAQARNLGNRFRSLTFANCWHRNSVESEAMWRAYSLLGEGVAIRTTVERLHDALVDARELGHFHGGLVRYSEAPRSVDQLGNALTWAFTKRPSFEHENEYRLILLWTNAQQPEAVIPCSVELSVLILEIVLSPWVPAWYVATLAEVCGRFGLDVPIYRSRLFDPPNIPFISAGPFDIEVN